MKPFSGMESFEVRVVGFPDVHVIPSTAKVSEGSDVTFTCSAKAR